MVYINANIDAAFNKVLNTELLSEVLGPLLEDDQLYITLIARKEHFEDKAYRKGEDYFLQVVLPYKQLLKAEFPNAMAVEYVHRRVDLLKMGGIAAFKEKLLAGVSEVKGREASKQGATENITLGPLPLKVDIQTTPVFKQLAAAARALAELKGEAKTIPNESILINTLGLQEAKDSSAVENILTSNDELFRASVDESYENLAAKEVQNYVEALITGFQAVRDSGLLTNRTILEIQRRLEKNRAGFRTLPGTTLKNSKGEVVYTPPQDGGIVLDLMSNLEKYINDDGLQDLDPLIKMAIIHFQFESIHPFYDGNGRTGRIINILYLVQKQLLSIPVLYLSRYIIDNKADYYRHLREIKDAASWESWILWMLKGVEVTSYQTIHLIGEIRRLMSEHKAIMKSRTSFYRKELLESLYRHPYTKIAFLENTLGVHRNTASTYLNELTELGILSKVKLGRSNYYVNGALFELLRKGYA